MGDQNGRSGSIGGDDDDVIHQEAITEELFRKAYHFQQKHEKSFKETALQSLSCSANTIFNVFPALRWIPKYNFRTNFIGDVVAGVTVSIMHIPHGLAYAQLGGVPPVSGLYMAIFPTIIYIFMGTSPHISLGTFAVLCMMAGKTVFELATVPQDESLTSALNMTNETSTFSPDDGDIPSYTTLQVAMAVTFTVGLWQLILGLLRLGALSVLLSNSLVSGFTTGAAVHVVSYQFKNLLGVPARAFSGPLKLVYFYIDIITNISMTNMMTLYLSISSLIIMTFFNEVCKPKIQKRFPKCKIPFPIELLVIIAGILSSYFLDLSEEYGVKVVKTVPTGLPLPTAPPFELLPKIIIDSLVIAIVAASISLSLAAIFAKKSKYEVSGNQDLLAYGCANLFGSFFMCLPVSASLSRSLIQHSVGGKTMIANLVTIVIIVLILLFIGPVFEPVPYCVLSAIVVVTLKGLLLQVYDFPVLYKQSKLDGAVWILTFLSVVLIDLDYGLLIGIIISVTTMLLRSQTPHISVLGQVPNTSMFLDTELYTTAITLPQIALLQITGSLHFANAQQFHAEIIKHARKLSAVAVSKVSTSVVLVMTCVAYVDPAAANMISTLYKDLKDEGCKLYITNCNPDIYDTFIRCNLFQLFPKEQILATVYDAVQYLRCTEL